MVDLAALRKKAKATGEAPSSPPKAEKSKPAKPPRQSAEPAAATAKPELPEPPPPKPAAASVAEVIAPEIEALLDPIGEPSSFSTREPIPPPRAEPSRSAPALPANEPRPAAVEPVIEPEPTLEPTPAVATAILGGEAASTAEQHEYLTFVLGEEDYAMPIDRIVEIVPYRPPTPVPTAEGSIVGILSLRGVLVTILDFRSRLGSKTAPIGADARFVVLDLEKEMVGLLVDRVQRVLRFTADDIEPPPRIDANESSELIRGVVERGGKIVVLLDIDHLLGVAAAVKEES